MWGWGTVIVPQPFSDSIETAEFRHKGGRAMLAGVDSPAGKVRCFEDMT